MAGGGRTGARRGRRVWRRLSAPLLYLSLLPVGCGTLDGDAGTLGPLADAPAGVAAPAPPPDPDSLPWPVGCPPVRKALWVGSYVPRGEHGFHEEWIDEAGLRVVWNKERAGRRVWAGAHGDGDVFPLDVVVRDRQGPAVAYVYTLLSRVGVPDPFAEDAFPDAPAVLHLRHRGRVQVRLDGELVIDAPAPPPGAWGTARAAVTLTGPYDVVLVKAGRGDASLGDGLDFELRASTPHGHPLDGQSWNTMRPPSLPSDLPPPEEAGDPDADPR